MRKIKPSFVPAIAWFIISTILLTLPGSSFPKEDWLSKIWFDKWVHTGMFSIMVVLWCWSMLTRYRESKKLKRIFLVLAIAWLLYGIGMEFVQQNFIPNRSFDPGDIAADAAGCALGLLFSNKRFIKN